MSAVALSNLDEEMIVGKKYQLKNGQKVYMGKAAAIGRFSLL